ncbi:MAG: type II secretion system F family protein [Candidatus Omnitrophica bacterium]|nr:type II secretion system F family protein [Candidatus Omnitrophota bacterium]
MPRYFYIVRDRQGKKISGVEDASTQEEAVSRLQAKDLIVITLFPEVKEAVGLKAEVAAEAKFRPKHSRVTSDDLVLFCRQLATLLGAGVTILKSLDIISQQVSSRKLYSIIKTLQKDMEGGFSFHEAMAKHPAVFSELWINLVESGEASGNLALVLGRLAGYLERNEAFKRKIISALIYPAILLFAGTGALLFLTIKIIPTFTELFKGFDIDLPLLTQMLVAVSEFIRGWILYIVIGIAVGTVMVRRYISTKPGRKAFEKVLFKLPVFGEFFRILVIERFTSEMATLVESGVPILYSLEITEHSVNNLTLGEIISQVKDDVREGKPLSQPLERSGFFDPMAVQMVTIGEEIGELSNMFKRLNAFYQEFVDTFLTRLTTMFEPFMLVFMGVIIGIMVIGMFLPIFKIAQIK